MDDKTLALLGDSAAAERLTEAGVLLPCPFCGGEAMMDERVPIHPVKAMRPLTVEELRGMDRPTPVWAEVDGKTIEGWDGYWCLCQNGKILAPSRLVIQAENMDGVEFYAYPPAHIDREAWTAEWIKRDGYTECSKCEHWYEEEGDRPAFCPSCGRAMTPEARAELNKRLRG